MKELLLFILILILLFLFILIFIRNRGIKIQGGEFRKYSNVNLEVVPSISSIEVLDSLIPSVYNDVELENISPFDYLLSRSMKRLKDISSFNIINEDVYCETYSEAHLVSDANIDFIGIILNGNSVEKGFACCEWHGDSFSCEPNEIMTTYNQNRFSLKRGVDNIQCDKEFLDFIGNPWFKDEDIQDASYVEITDLKTTLTMDMIYEKFNAILSNQILTDDEKNDRIKALGLSYRKKDGAVIPKLFDVKHLSLLEEKGHKNDSIYLKKIAKITKLSNVNQQGKLNKSNLVRCLMDRRDIFKTLTHSIDQPQIEIYIEYSYGKSRKVIDLYPMIHKHTQLVIQNIIKHHRMVGWKNDEIYIFCLRFQLETNDLDDKNSKLQEPTHNYINFQDIPIISNIEILTDDQTKKRPIIHVYFYDECHYANVRVPHNNSEFSYDEQLYFEIDKENYSIQIEHSENGWKHKSNMIEFLGRNLAPILDFKDLHDFIKNNYPEIVKDNDYLRWNYCDHETIPIHESVIYKAFGTAYAQQLFENNPSEAIH